MALESLHSTSERILDAASELFAERGFQDTSIRDISSRANVNLAAVNYHFRDKESLYEAILLQSFEQIQKAYPFDLTGDSPEEHLEGFVRILLFRLLGKGRPAIHGKLMAAEMASPTGALDRLCEDAIRPTHETLIGILRELVGDAPEQDMNDLASCVLGQCLVYKHAGHVLKRLHGGLPEEDDEIEKLAKQITAFSLAGIAAYRA
ncbi:MAG: CerR family C-terminal domain-containing protein [Candidatus Hydrogenedentes bacterium]|nr:CerR family C-terminal domain-containing protein [Candidatus Hydrogenedentota bacterium]